MTPPCVVPTFRPYAAENLEFGGFYASSCESRVNQAMVIVAVIVPTLNFQRLHKATHLDIPL